jgi:hypothetical protein
MNYCCHELLMTMAVSPFSAFTPHEHPGAQIAVNLLNFFSSQNGISYNKTYANQIRAGSHVISATCLDY